jgi:RNA polymerase sigma-70 factor (ECF subfamily)
LRIEDSLFEQALLKRLVSGDENAFSMVFSACYTDLVLFAMTIVRNSDIAEEIVQEIFVKLWEGHENLQIKTSLRSYLLRSVQNRCIDWYRHEKVRQSHIEDISSHMVLFDCDTDEYMFGSELEERIEKILSLIPPDCSEAFRMNREQGLKYNDIAEKLSVSVRTVEVRVSKALHLLRKHLQDYLS